MNELSLGPIVGGLSHRGAFLWGKARVDQTVGARLHAWIGLMPDMSDAQLAGTSLPMIPQDGYAGVVPLDGLQANTRYYYALNLKSNPPAEGEGPLPGGLYPYFRTFPMPGESVAFNFAFGSCFRPAEPNSGKIFRALDARRLADDLRFVLMIGDQIYADDFEHNALGKVAETLDEYRAVYQYVWGWPELRQLLCNLPAFMTLDDHEVDDDWRWIDKNRRTATIPWWDALKRVLRGRPLVFPTGYARPANAPAFGVGSGWPLCLASQRPRIAGVYLRIWTGGVFRIGHPHDAGASPMGRLAQHARRGPVADLAGLAATRQGCLSG